MEFSPVVRGGVLLNKNKNTELFHKKSLFSQAVSCAIAGVSLISINVGATVTTDSNGYTVVSPAAVGTDMWQFVSETVKGVILHQGVDTQYRGMGEQDYIGRVTLNITEDFVFTPGGYLELNSYGTVNVGRNLIANGAIVTEDTDSYLSTKGNASFTNQSSIKLWNGYLGTTDGNLEVSDSTLLLQTNQSRVSAGNTLILTNSTVESSGASTKGKSISLSGANQQYIAKTGTNTLNADTSLTASDKAKILASNGAVLNLTTGTGATFERSAVLETQGTTNITGALSVNDGASVLFSNTATAGLLKLSSLTLNQGSIEIVQNGKGRLEYTADDLSFVGGSVNIAEGGNFVAASQNGSVTFGDMNVAGTAVADNRQTTGNNADGKAILAGKVTLQGADANGGLLTANSFTANPGASLQVESGKYGQIVAKDQQLLDLTNVDTEVNGTLTLKGDNLTGAKISKVTVGNGGKLNIEGSLEKNDASDVLALNGADKTTAGVVSAKDYSAFTGILQTAADKFGAVSSAASNAVIDLAKSTLDVLGTLTLGLAAENSTVTLKKAEVTGVLNLSNVLQIDDANNTNITLKGDADGKGLIKVKADNGDGKVAGLVLATETKYNGLSITDAAEADFSDVKMTIKDGTSLTLSAETAGDKDYKNIGALTQVTNKGDLRLAGQNVTFSTGALFSNSGVVSFDDPTADRTITITKADFERTVANGRFDIGKTEQREWNNFEVTGTNADALDISQSLLDNDGWFNTEHTVNTAGGTGKISGDGILQTAWAKIGSLYNDLRLELQVDKLTSAAEEISIGGLVTVAKEIAFDTAKTLNLTDNGVLTLGTDGANGDDYKFNLSAVDVNFNGGRLVAKAADGTAVTDPVDADTSHVKVKSLNFAQNAGQGSLTIKSGTKVQVVGNKDDYSQRYFNTNGNTTQGLVTLDGPGATLIVDAKDLLKATSDGYYVALDTKPDADGNEKPAGVIGGYGTLQIDDFLGLAKNDQPNAEKPKLNINQFVQLREELAAAGVINGVTDTTGGKSYNVLIKLNKDDVEGFFDDNGNVDRGNGETKEWLDNPISAKGDLVYNVKEDDPAKDKNGNVDPNNRQEWGAAKTVDNKDTLLIGINGDRGTSNDLTLDEAGAGKGSMATDKKYFVRYDKVDAGETTAKPENKDLLGNIAFINSGALGTLANGGVIGAVRSNTGVTSATLTFMNSKGSNADVKEGFAAADILMASNKIVADNADVVVRKGTVPSITYTDRDTGDLKAGTLVVRNDSTFTIEGTSVVDNLLFGNDAEGGKVGSTNKVDFKGDATVMKIVADGSQVTYKRDNLGNLTADHQDGAAGNVEVKFNTTGTNRVDAAEVADGNSLTLSGKAEVRNTKVNGTLTVADASVVLKDGLSVYGTGDNVASAFIKNGSLQASAGVGSNGKGFMYLGSTQNTLETPNTIGKNWTDSLSVLNERLPGSSYTGIGYLDENGYDISNATINIGSVARGSQGTLTVGAGGALIVTDQALTRPADGQWNYTAGMKGNIANEGGTVMIGDLNKIGNKTTIKLAEGTVTGTPDAVWITKNPLYTLTLKDDGILYASFNSTASDAITGKVDKDLADIIKDQGNKDQNQGGGFDKDRKDGNGFISKVLDDTVTNENGVDFDATADRIGKTLTSSTRFAVLGGAAQNSQLASDMVTAQIEERAGFRTSTASRITTDNGEAGSLWVNPLYNKNRSGHLNAGHYSYGLDADLYGMSFGGDVAVNDTFRIGAAFSGGKGNSDAVGGLMPTKNDFDFYSGSLYAITDIGSVTLLTDLDYTWLKGDVKQTNRITTLNSTLKSDVTSFGVSAKRTFEVNNGTLVAPYAGVRVNRLHINGYDVKDTDGNTIITAESQQQYYATVPVGVQVSKNIELTNGFVKPVLDLGLVTTLGSRHMESRVTYTGFGETSATSEVRDRTAFTVKFGVNAEVGNLGLGLGYGLTGSQSLTSNQVYGNVRYRF